MASMPGSSNNEQNTSHPEPKLPAPKVPHVYVEKGLWGGKIEKR
jgi:hypothetical protein